MPNKPKIEGKGFEFVSNGHSYYLDGKPMTGVTTILGVISKPMLIQWAANEAVKYVKEKWGTNGLSHNELMQVLEEAKTAHRKKKEDAGLKGTDVHAIIESIIKGAIAYEGYIQQHIPDENDQVYHFIDWAIDNHVKFLDSEKKVYSRELFVAGTIDFICEIDGDVYIGDIKTSSAIYPEHFFQTAGYQRLLKDMGSEYEVNGHVILNCRKDGTFEEKRSISNKDNMEAFMSALTLYRVMEKFKNNII